MFDNNYGLVDNYMYFKIKSLAAIRDYLNNSVICEQQGHISDYLSGPFLLCCLENGPHLVIIAEGCLIFKRAQMNAMTWMDRSVWS